MSYIHGFTPIADAQARRLVLGSMPGKASLLAQQYYAHPRNAFWPIMQGLLDLPATLDYATGCQQLMNHRIAVWDVLKTCTRSSSLDSDILESSIIANDFAEFFQAHPDIQAVYFNGAKAESLYRKYVHPKLAQEHARLALTRLPSTSPAYAAMNLQTKLGQWRVLKG